VGRYPVPTDSTRSSEPAWPTGSRRSRLRIERPASPEEAAALLGAAGAERAAVRFQGGGTKLAWGNPRPDPGLEISTERLDGILEHNEADLTAIVQAGVPVAHAQAGFAEAGQMLALDPPLGNGAAATMGGVVAAGDSGPLRHRYGGPRDLLLGLTVALSDGTVSRSGGKVIKNVAGYDLPKLFSGSFGTLGLIVQMSIRLHPLPTKRLTAIGKAGDPEVVQQGVLALARAPLELDALDVAWSRGGGRILARCGGAVPEARAERAVVIMENLGLHGEVAEEDEAIWAEQRNGQRSANGVVVRVSGLPASLATILHVADRLDGSVVGRAGAGLSWVALPPQSVEDAMGAVEDLRRSVDPFACVVLDAPRGVKEKVDVWGASNGPAMDLSRRVKAAFDPAHVCNPGVFVGDI
jgi:glycolate oxidase FAD binding subunit